MIIIVGANEIGVNVAIRLLKTPMDVIILEQNEVLAKKVSAEYDFPVITGDATKPQVLKNIGVDKADTVVALTSSDQKNLMTCLYAKKLGAKRAIAKVNMSENQRMFMELGIDVAIAPSLVLSHFFDTAVNGYTIVGTEKFESIFVEIPVHHRGMQLKPLKNHKAKLVSIYREEGFFTPCDDDEILPRDILVIVGSREDCRKMAVEILG
ncbi:MAG: hypothetical protein B6U97_04030 [Candidatus Altiarchaeales archaeon ex4484_96]|nr:MAG: hypothetical protein B6U97_04030 [Candidatus Altiarchaeales archaeon ex4484_96]